MKQLVLVVLVASTVSVAQAQENPARRHQVSVGLLGLAPSPGVQYHYRLSKTFTLGAEASYSLVRDWKEAQAGVVGRAYFAGHAPTGLYSQLRLDADVSQLGRSSARQENVLHYGSYSAGSLLLGLGYQARLGGRWLAQAGVDAYVYPVPFVRTVGLTGDWWQAGQPGGVFDAQLTLGYLL